MYWIVIIGMVLFLKAGAPLAYTVGAATVLTFIITDNVRYLAILPQRIFSQMDVFSLMAMPLFMLGGEIMNRTGVTRYLVNFSMSVMGRFKGGLGHVNIMTSVFFAGVSGSAVADAAALSNTLVPAMRERGYTSTYAAALTAAASIIGPIIPPSIIMVFYGVLMQVSIGGLLMSGVVPGLMLGGALMAANTYFAYRYNHPGGRGEQKPSFLPSFIQALPALALPVVILGGIAFGIVTPTEAAGLAVVAALGAGMFYRGVNRSNLIESFKRSASLTGSIFVVMAAAACFGWIAALEHWPQQIATFATELGLSGVSFLLMINAVFLLCGMFLDIPVTLALIVPLFGPAATAQGIHPIHLGIVICLNLTIGMMTPPYGACLVVVSAIVKENYWSLSRAVLPFIFVEAAVLMLITFIPEISLFLPRMFGFA
jgi:tripartite ATP-independent transporter DctM subunit